MIQAALLFGALATFLLGIFVIQNNPRMSLFRTYFILSIFTTAWLLVNALTTVGPIVVHGELLLFLSRLITPLSLLVSLSFLYFFVLFKRGALHWQDFIIAIPGLVVSLFSFSPLNVYLNSSRQPTLGGLFTAYIIVILIYALLTLYLLFGPNRGRKNSPYTKPQLMYLRLGAVITIVPAIGFGVILSNFGDSSLTSLGPLFSIVFLVFLSIAMIRHHLFDLRLVVARSVAYIFSFGFIGLIYGSFIFALSSLPIFRGQAVYLQRIEYVGFALVTSLIYAPIKRFFAKVTDKILYQDAYDPQLFLDQLNQSLVSSRNNELDQLLKTCSQIISSNLKSEYCMFVIKESDLNRVITTGTIKKFVDLNISIVQQMISRLNIDVIITDLLPPETEKFKRLLISNNIAILVRLAPKMGNSKSKHSDLGYIVLGPKLSGNIYGVKDKQVLGIIANELVIAVQNALHFEEIQRFNITLQQKVDDATRKLRRTNQRLEELDETKDDFISMASHQLRTPLTSVKGYLSMVLEGDAGKVNATQTKMLHQAFISSQRMVFLITDLLNVSRLKTGKFVIEANPVDLSKLIQEEVSQLVETAQVKQIEITYDKPVTFPLLMLDETKTRQIGMNFMDNAIYYTPVGGHIKVELIDNPNTVELRVSDNGIGVPKSEQHHLFTKFYRASNARRTRPDGTGLGLFMAKKVIAAEGGSIIFESREGHGSTFGFVFSKAKLKVPDSAGPKGDGISLESTELHTQKQSAKSLTEVR
jgi:signal transduction histidine kinase